MKRWLALTAAVVLAGLVFLWTLPDGSSLKEPSEVEDAIPVPSQPQVRVQGVSGALPDRSPYVVRFGRPVVEELTGISAGIMMALEDRTMPAGVLSVGLGQAHAFRAAEAETGLDPNGVFFALARDDVVAIEFYPEALAALGAEAGEVIAASIRTESAAGDPVVLLEAPFRWATDVEMPVSMEATYRSFAVRRGCDSIAVACSALGGVQLIPLDRLSESAPSWDAPVLSLESPATRPPWHASYLDPGPFVETVTSPEVFWTGTEMIIWGGTSGGAYNPATGEWRALASSPLPSSTRSRAMWDGGKMVVVSEEGLLAYDPGSDSWISLSDVGVEPPPVPGRIVSTGAELFVWGERLDRYDLTTREWTLLPEPPFPVGSGREERALYVFGGKLLAAGSTGDCEGVSLAIWDGSDWEMLPLPGREAPFFAACATSRQVAVLGDTLFVWDLTHAVMLSPDESEWVFAGRLDLVGGGGSSGAIQISGRLLVPQYGRAAIYDPERRLWDKIRLPGWGTDWEMVWTGTEVLMWGPTRCCPYRQGPYDAWRWTPPEP